MTKLQKLIKEGLEAAEFRGHDIQKVSADKDNSAYFQCTNCECGFFADTHPGPNGIDLGGSALATHCLAQYTDLTTN